MCMCDVLSFITATQQREKKTFLVFFFFFSRTGLWRCLWCWMGLHAGPARPAPPPLVVLILQKHGNLTTLNKALTRGRLDGGSTHTFACLVRKIVGHLVARVALHLSSFALQEVLNMIVLSLSGELDFRKEIYRNSDWKKRNNLLIKKIPNKTFKKITSCFWRAFSSRKTLKKLKPSQKKKKKKQFSFFVNRKEGFDSSKLLIMWLVIGVRQRILT